MIYLDNSATTRIDDQVLEAMLPWLQDGYGNASSAHLLGRRARVAIESAREEIASYINAHPAELIFTSGGTESNNTIVKSCLHESALCDRLVYSSVEHHAIIHPAEQCAAEGTDVRVLPVNQNGVVNIEDCSAFNAERTLVSVMHANNETGIVHNLAEIRAAMPDVLLHSDAVQSFTKIPFDAQALGVDFASFSAHKIHGPKGIGAMFIRKGLDFKAHQHGGGQERNRRAGTENVAAIVGFQMAARIAMQNFSNCTEQSVALIQVLRTELMSRIAHLRFNTPEHGALPNVINVSFHDADRLDGDAILQLMDLHGVACSNGSACVSGTMQPSHVLVAMGRSQEESRAAIRFSISKFTTENEVLKAVSILEEIVTDMRASHS